MTVSEPLYERRGYCSIGVRIYYFSAAHRRNPVDILICRCSDPLHRTVWSGCSKNEIRKREGFLHTVGVYKRSLKRNLSYFFPGFKIRFEEIERCVYLSAAGSIFAVDGYDVLAFLEQMIVLGSEVYRGIIINPRISLCISEYLCAVEIEHRVVVIPGSEHEVCILEIFCILYSECFAYPDVIVVSVPRGRNSNTVLISVAERTFSACPR